MFQRLKRVFGFASETDEEDQELMIDDEEGTSSLADTSSDSPTQEEVISENDLRETSTENPPAGLSAGPYTEADSTEECTPTDTEVGNTLGESAASDRASDETSSTIDRKEDICEERDTETKSETETSLRPVSLDKEVEENGENSEIEASNTDHQPTSSSPSDPCDLLGEIKRLTRQSEPRYVKECLASVVSRLRLYQSLETELRAILEENSPLEQEKDEYTSKTTPDDIAGHDEPTGTDESRRLKDEKTDSEKERQKLIEKIEYLSEEAKRREEEIAGLRLHLAENERKISGSNSQVSPTHSEPVATATVNNPEKHTGKVTGPTSLMLLQDKYPIEEDTRDFPVLIPPVSVDDKRSYGADDKGTEIMQPTDSVDSLREENEQLRRSLTEVRTTLEETRHSLTRTREDLTKSNEAVEERDNNIADLQQSITETKSRLERVQTELEALRQRNTELDEIRKKRDLMVAEANAKAHRTRVDSEKTISEKEAQIAGLKLRLAELESTEQQLLTAKAENEHLSDSLAQSSEEVKSYRTEIETLKSKLSEIEGKYNAAMEGLIEQAGPEVTFPTKRKRGRPRKSDKTVGEPANRDTQQSNGQSNGKPIQVPTIAANESDIASEPHNKGYADPDSVLTPEKNAPVREEATAASKRKVKPDVSTIDELLNGADWMESPTPPKKARKSSKRQDEEDDFGYKAPPPRHPDSDAQMSLFGF